MEVLKDKDCTIQTPVVLGVKDAPIYGNGVVIKPGEYSCFEYARRRLDGY